MCFKEKQNKMFVLQKLIMAKSVIFYIFIHIHSPSVATRPAFHSIYLFIFTDENEKEKREKKSEILSHFVFHAVDRDDFFNLRVYTWRSLDTITQVFLGCDPDS